MKRQKCTQEIRQLEFRRIDYLNIDKFVLVITRSGDCQIVGEEIAIALGEPDRLEQRGLAGMLAVRRRI